MKKILFLFPFLTLFLSFSVFAQYQKLHDFSPLEGYSPHGDLVTDSTWLYGMTMEGGTGHHGTIFRLRTDGTGYKLLFEFNGANGAGPNGSLVVSKGFLYGVTRTGGAFDGGVVFKLDTTGNIFEILHQFVPGSDTGFYPNGSLLLVDSTALFGMTSQGGTFGTHGVIYTLNADGTGFTTFYGPDQSGYCRFGDRMSYVNGYLYGMISEGDNNSDQGGLFRIRRLGFGYSNFYDFSGTDGASPMGFPVAYRNKLYGLTRSGGPDSAGVIFRVSTDGLFYTILQSFNAVDPGGYPEGSLLLQDSTILYGMSRGATPETGCMFRISLDGTGYTLLHTFQQGTDGYYPDGTPILLNHKLYGMTEKGGNDDAGVIYSYSLVPQGIDEHSRLPEVLVYPNPAVDRVRVSASEEMTDLSILDLNGKIVREIASPGKTCEVDLGGISRGLYIIRLTGNDFRVERKLVK
ncbi:MAG TPA: choice-of-anchor tandem repeat GloVer-containing protein [Bacteroidales bacterium]|nr:choice-of-anchor tandem repeat GloVer-containing protein [Bacteroidales bacterium]